MGGNHSIGRPKITIAWAATREKVGIGALTWSHTDPRGKGLMIADVSRAFFEAPATRGVCVELPEEALGTGEAVAGSRQDEVKF